MGYSCVKYVACTFTLIMTASCGTTMLIDTNLKTDATIMPVKRTALFLGKEIVSFGTYYTGKVDRTPTLSSILNTEMDVKTLKEDIRFEMKDGSTNKSNVYCIGKLGKEDLSLAGRQDDEEEDVENLTNKQNNTFKGTIDYQNSESKWHFLIINSYSLGGDTSLGYLSNGSLRISIEQVNVYMSGHMTEDERLGYEYILNNEVIGAIDFTGHGRVIMKNDVPGDIKFALANISAALFLKSDLRDSY